ncbi:MAG: hypothetical protein FJ137_08810 [Deltaproteobacteria bacterium]|nr:hypothetical protein [Deltaproteobacteria bacterium]
MTSAPLTMPPEAALASLERALLDARALGSGDLRARLRWLESAATAAGAVALNDEGRAGALHLQAALGAIVQWSQGPKDPASLVALDALVRTLTTRGYLAMLRSLAAAYDALVDERAPHRAACAEARDALRTLAKSVEHGQPPPPVVAERLAALRAAALAAGSATSTASSSSTSSRG